MKEGNGVVHSQLFHVITLTFESYQIYHPVFLFMLVCVVYKLQIKYFPTMTSSPEASEAPILYALIVT